MQWTQFGSVYDNSCIETKTTAEEVSVESEWEELAATSINRKAVKTYCLSWSVLQGKSIELN